MLSGCSSAPVVLPPKIVEVVKPAPVPAACKRLQAIVLPPGTTAEQVMKAQAIAILAYEEQVKECAK